VKKVYQILSISMNFS